MIRTGCEADRPDVAQDVLPEARSAVIMWPPDMLPCARLQPVLLHQSNHAFPADALAVILEEVAMNPWAAIATLARCKRRLRSADSGNFQIDVDRFIRIRTW